MTFSGRSGERTQVPTPDGQYVVQTINLKDWQAVLPTGNHAQGVNELSRGLAAVTEAVKALNGNLPPIDEANARRPDLAGYALYAVAPNWITSPTDD
jgi:hypothetical protein